MANSGSDDAFAALAGLGAVGALAALLQKPEAKGIWSKRFMREALLESIG